MKTEMRDMRTKHYMPATFKFKLIKQAKKHKTDFIEGK